MKLIKILVCMAVVGCFGCSDSEQKKSGVVVTPDAGGNNGVDDCGNGRLDPGERCDSAIEAGQPGACPTECSTDACAPETLFGSAATCSASCEPQEATCTNGDGCCGPGCDSSNDDDCSNTCGNGIVEEPETCDGNCAPCATGNACLVSSSTGSVESCSLVCKLEPVTACEDDDGCCPANCSFDSDNDCTCTPTTTCQNRGWTCGEIADDGCGQTVSCGTCRGSDVCIDNRCEDGMEIGTRCAANSDCDSGGCLTAAGSSFPGGYCTKGCRADSDCGPYHCDFIDDDGDGICLQSCQSNAECRPNHECFDDTGDGNKECFPVGNGNSPIGGPCAVISDCSSGQMARCHIGPLWTGGACSKLCDTDADCPSSSTCTSGGCLVDCNSDGDCRSGYVCIDWDDQGSRQCFPGATGNKSVGESCANISQCSGGRYGICILEFPAGYCSRLCGPGEGTCPAGSHCVNTGDVSVCFEGCSSSSDCRSGYICSNDGTNDICAPM